MEYRYSDTRAFRECVAPAAMIIVLVGCGWVVTHVPLVGGRDLYFFAFVVIWAAAIGALFLGIRAAYLNSRPITISSNGISARFWSGRCETINWADLTKVQQVVYVDRLTNQIVSTVRFSSKDRLVRVRSNIDGFNDILTTIGPLLKAHGVVIQLRDLQAGGHLQEVAELASLLNAR